MDMNIMLGTGDLVALALFILAWLGLDVVLESHGAMRAPLSLLMARQRREWMLTLADRDLRMIDTAILQGLQQGSAFFGSTSILAVGGGFALLSSTDTVLQIVGDLPFGDPMTRTGFEIKVLGLIVIFTYAFFKFGWAYRLFNYCGILMGAVPMVSGADLETRRAKAVKAAEMNIIASRHFTAGMRAIFFALGYLGWFVGPFAFMASTLFVLAVLVRRQYFSEARAIVDDGGA